MAQDCRYSYFRVPKAQQGLSRSAQQYKELRLQALKQSPLSFSATYASESALPDTYWTSRLSSIESETFICGEGPNLQCGNSSSESESDEQSLDRKWIAQLTLLGPRTKDQWTTSATQSTNEPSPAAQSDTTDDDDDEEEERWQLLGLYNLPEYRGKGIAKALCLKAIEYLIKERRNGPKNVVVRLMVKGTMPEVVRFYEKLGFETVGRCSLADAFIANGEGHMLPEDYRTQERLCARGGYIMVKRLTRAG